MNPILYTFRRCPYAMRARLALLRSNTAVNLREITLKQKPTAMLKVAPNGTVPVLVLPDGSVIDESLDIVRWAQVDPARAFDPYLSFLHSIETDFKVWLDRYKYYMPEKPYGLEASRDEAAKFLYRIERRLSSGEGLAGTGDCAGGESLLVEDCVLPFVRQFANVDRPWFDNQPWPHVIQWLESFLASAAFNRIMHKYVPWQPEQGSGVIEDWLTKGASSDK